MRTSVEIFSEACARRDPHREPSVGELRSALSRALAEIAELRASVAASLEESARLREKVTELERRVSESSGRGGSGGGGGSDPFEVLRENTQAARDAKARRAAARTRGARGVGRP